METFDLFSRRQPLSDLKALTTISIPKKVRQQIVQLLRQALGSPTSDVANMLYKEFYRQLCIAYGVNNLHKTAVTAAGQLFNFILETTENEKLLDATELMFRYIYELDEPALYEVHCRLTNACIEPAQAIKLLNKSFSEHGIVYSFSYGEISKRAHIIKTHSENEKQLMDCLQLLKDVLQEVCAKQRWEYHPADTIETLIAICHQHQLITDVTLTEIISLKRFIDRHLILTRNTDNQMMVNAPAEISERVMDHLQALTTKHIIHLRKKK